MRTPAVVRKMDALGRIVIPVELRRMLQLEQEQELELYVCEDGLILRKFSPGCIFCGEMVEIVVFHGKNVCRRCREKLCFPEKSACRNAGAS